MTELLTFDFQHQVGGRRVADEALRGDAPEVVVPLRGEANAVSCHCHAATGTQAAVLQQLETSSTLSQ